MHPASGNDVALLSILVPFVVIGSTVLIFPVISRIGGWNSLVPRFRYDGPWNGRTWTFQTATFRKFTNYNGCLTVGAGEHGLYLKPLWIVRFAHPPLLIPWHEISYRTGHGAFLGDYTTFTLGTAEQVPCRVYRGLARELATLAAEYGCQQTF